MNSGFSVKNVIVLVSPLKVLPCDQSIFFGNIRLEQCFHHHTVYILFHLSFDGQGIGTIAIPYGRNALNVQVYYINKIYYPIYNISCRIRGGYNVGLTDELWSEMLIPNADPEIIIKRRTDKKKTKKNSNDDSHMPSQYEQISMF